MATVIRMVRTGVFILILTTTSVLVFGRTQLGGFDPAAQAELLQREIQRYTELQNKGGWPAVSPVKKSLRQGDTSPVVRQLKKRLQASGDLSVTDTSSVFTTEMDKAVKKVQRQFCFAENGIVDEALVKALNVPVEKRLEQLQVNLERLQTSPIPNEGKRIVVNIPDYKLSVYEDAVLQFDMKVVVGKTSSKTATFDDELTHIVFSPYWNVPQSIVQNEILPAMKKKRDYLSANGYEITGQEGGLPVIRQKPGIHNALGLVKFLFPNHHAIYFHDTPVKSTFKNRVRANSHGCIRLEDPERLANYLLKDDPSWTPEKINKAMYAGKEQWVKLATAVPVYITYFTAWVDDRGVLHFRDDIYRYDTGAKTHAAFKNS
jgi:L,D-transpeptidase YcbB